jgi:hypothetical protein
VVQGFFSSTHYLLLQGFSMANATPWLFGSHPKYAVPAFRHDKVALRMTQLKCMPLMAKC